MIDTSASVAILFGEPEAATFAEILEQDLVRLISAASVLEAAIMVESEFGHRGARERDHLLYQARSTSAVLTRALGPRPAMPWPSASIGKPPP